MLKLLLFFFVVLIYDINGVCTNNDDYSIEILFLLDGTPSDVDSTQWQLQIDAVTNYVSEMKNSTKVAITQMGASFSSMPSYTTVSDLKSQTISLTQDTGLTSRNPAITIQSAVSNGFTDTFAQQKLLIIFTAGEITGTGTNYCGWNYEVKSKLIEVIIIGIGNSFYPGIGSDPSDGYAQLQFQCLLKDNQDVDQSTNKGLNIVSDFTQLTTITSDLKGNYFCIPNTQRLFVVTEIRPSSASNQFIEILNYGPPFSTANIEFTGNVLSRTGVSSGTATILQGQIVVISDQAITLCSTNCLVPSAGAQTLTTAGWQAATQINWSVGVTIGGLTITITHSTTNNEWWIADAGESYELFVIGGNPTFSDNWISSYNQNEGTPGGYGYSNTAVRRDFSQDQVNGDLKCHETSQGGVVNTCINCYNTSTKICDCSGLATTFATNFYANRNDPSVCRRLPRMISSYGCNVFPQGSGINEAFRFGTIAPNTDMDFWLLYIEYPNPGSTPYLTPIIDGRTYQSIDSNVKNATKGYIASTDRSPSNTGAGNKIGVTDRNDGTNVGDTINCGFGTLNPTMAHTNEPTTIPSSEETNGSSRIQTAFPTKLPTVSSLFPMESPTESITKSSTKKGFIWIIVMMAVVICTLVIIIVCLSIKPYYNKKSYENVAKPVDVDGSGLS